MKQGQKTDLVPLQTAPSELTLFQTGGTPSVDQFLDRINENLEPVKGMYADYSCAAMEVETKFNVLDERLSIRYDRNPIETIKTRIKEPDSIVRKLEKKGYPMTLDSIYEHVRDVAGVRVVCSFISDIYRLADCFLQQDDITLIERKDYIKNPKPGGYRSLHLIVQVPIFTEVGKKLMYVEVQLRTIAMDFWASLEHKLRYKKDIPEETLAGLARELRQCADESAELDRRMERIRDRIAEAEDAEEEPG